MYIQRGKGLCVCALDIDRPGCRERSMAHGRRSVSIGDPSTYSLIRLATCARAHTHTPAPPRTTTAHASATDRAHSAAVRAGPEAAHTLYNVVTRTVFHAPMLALKADASWNACEPINATLGGGVKCSHALAHTHERARARTPRRVRGACPPRRYARTTIGVHGRACVHIVWKFRSRGACESMAVRRGNRTRTHEAQRRTVSPRTRTLVRIGEAPTHTPAHA
jgi:hypothetical protein